MLTITHSSKECFLACHRRYYYEYDELLKPCITPWSLLDGKALHLGLELLYRGRVVHGDNNATWGSTEGLEPIIDKIYDQERGQEDESQVFIHKGTIMAMLKGYVVAYSPDEFEEFNPEVQGETVVENKYAIDKQSFLLKFKTDALVKKNGAQYLFETKSTSAQDMARFLKSLGIDDQPDTYLYGWHKNGIEAKGVIYNVIRKAKLQQGKLTDEKFVERLEKAYLEDAALPAVERKYYFRETIYRNDDDLDKFEEDLRQVVSDMENYMPYRAPKRCTEFFGKDCDFLPMCSGSDCKDIYIKKAARHEEYV